MNGFWVPEIMLLFPSTGCDIERVTGDTHGFRVWEEHRGGCAPLLYGLRLRNDNVMVATPFDYRAILCPVDFQRADRRQVTQ